MKECYLELVCRIETSAGVVPEVDKKVAPICDVLHSAFQDVRVRINDQIVSNTTSHYNIRTYISHTLTYSSAVKNSFLETHGYYADTAGFFDKTNPDINSGFGNRNKLFRKNFSKTGEYKVEGTRFFGKLNLDLVSISSGLPPGTKVTIELDKAPDSFILMKDDSDTENYKFKFLQCNLYVPVAQVTLPVYNQFNSLFAEKSVQLHFRRTEIRENNVPKDKAEFYSDNLFSEEMPCRVIVW